MKKDKILSIRINNEINEKIKEDGLTVQKIIDAYIDKNFKVEVTYEDGNTIIICKRVGG